MSRIDASLRSAIAGAGQIVFLAGDPGIGKTRLARQAADLATSRAFKVLWGRCWEAGGAPAFWPWIEVIRSYVRDVDDSALEADLGPHAPKLASLVPEIAVRLGFEPEKASEEESDKFLMFDAIWNLFRSATSVDPLLIVLDDLHSADPSSLMLLQFLSSRLPETSFLIIAGYRNSAPDLHPKTSELISEIATRGQVIELKGLENDEIHQFVTAITGRDIPEPLVGAIMEKTAGNPLFLDEVLRTFETLAETTDLTAASIRIPNHLREQIRRRLETQSDELLSALGSAAVVGREFDLPTLSRITEVAEDELTHLLELAEKAGIVTSASLGSYSFSHVLFQETLYEQLHASARTALHLRVADVLERSKDLAVATPQIAAHYVKIMSMGHAREARAWSLRAAELAMRTFAFDEAIRHVQEALQTAEHDPIPVEEHARMLLLSGRALRAAGEGEQSRQALREGVEFARSHALPVDLAKAVLEYTPSWGAVNPSDREMPELVEHALSLLPDDQVELKARLLCRWCSLSMWDPEAKAEREAKFQQATRLAKDLDSKSLDALIAVTWLPIMEQRPHKGMVDEAREAFRLAESAGSEDLALDARAQIIYRRLLLGQRKRALEDLNIYERLAERSRSPFHRWLRRMLSASEELVEGNFDQGIELADEAFALGMAAPIFDPLVYWAAFKGSTWPLRRDPDLFAENLPLMENAVREYPTLAVPRLGFAHFYSYQGMRDEAMKWLESVGESPVDTLPQDSRWVSCMTLLGEISFHLEIPELAARVADELEPFASFVALLTRGTNFYGIPRLALAAAAATAGRMEKAEEEFEKAVRFAATIGSGPCQGHAHMYYGWFLSKQGENSRAHTHLTRSTAIFESLGMTYPASKASALLEGLDTPAETEQGSATLMRQGDVWNVGLAGRTFILKDIKGLQYLSRLLAQPDREIPAMDLAMGSGSSQASVTASDDLSIGTLDPGLETLDETARRAYTDRIRELQAEIDETYDPGIKDRLQEEMDSLVDALSGAIGLGGRVRKTSSAAEKARLSVTRAIRSAIDKIAENDPVLGKHLSVSMRTGTFCSYSPDVSSKITWSL